MPGASATVCGRKKKFTPKINAAVISEPPVHNTSEMAQKMVLNLFLQMKNYWVNEQKKKKKITNAIVDVFNIQNFIVTNA